ncbi:hypothetical protein WA158_005532 [Blastocystis sp. Blastoise]
MSIVESKADQSGLIGEQNLFSQSQDIHLLSSDELLIEKKAPEYDPERDLVLIEHLSKNYTLEDGRVLNILKDISISYDSPVYPIQKGEFVIIRGPSGSGKTTLLNIIGTIDEPTSGDIYLLGEKMNFVKNDKQLSRIRLEHLGFVFQTFNLISTMSSIENVKLPMSMLHHLSSKEIEARAIELLQKMGLQDRMNHLPSEMSGGEQQRVTIARALSNSPSLILLDEPTGDLDSRTTIEVMNILLELNIEGTTCIMVTHNPDLECYAHRILYVKNGQIEKQIINKSQVRYEPDDYVNMVNSKKLQ